MRASTLGSICVGVNAFCIGGGAAQAALGNWKAATAYGLIGSIVGIASRVVLYYEFRALGRKVFR